MNVPLSAEQVFLGVVFPSYTTATPVEPIEPVRVPLLTVNLLPETVSVYVPSAIPVPEMLTSAFVPLVFERTIPLVPLSTYATLPEYPRFSD